MAAGRGPRGAVAGGVPRPRVVVLPGQPGQLDVMADQLTTTTSLVASARGLSVRAAILGVVRVESSAPAKSATSNGPLSTSDSNSRAAWAAVRAVVVPWHSNPLRTPPTRIGTFSAAHTAQAIAGGREQQPLFIFFFAKFLDVSLTRKRDQGMPRALGRERAEYFGQVVAT